MSNNTKEWVQYGLAVAMMVSGAVLTFISFCTRGDVTYNVLIYVGECITFAGGIFGVTMYWQNKGNAMMQELKNYISTKLQEKKEGEDDEDQ